MAWQSSAARWYLITLCHLLLSLPCAFQSPVRQYFSLEQSTYTTAYVLFIGSHIGMTQTTSSSDVPEDVENMCVESNNRAYSTPYVKALFPSHV